MRPAWLLGLPWAQAWLGGLPQVGAVEGGLEEQAVRHAQLRLHVAHHAGGGGGGEGHEGHAGEARLQHPHLLVVRPAGIPAQGGCCEVLMEVTLCRFM